jgi:isopenicillin-N epimerase
MPTDDLVYGAHRRADFPLDPAVTYLNHGGYGLTPHEVLKVQRAWRDRMESNPTRFVWHELTPALREAAVRVAGSVGATADDLVFIDNATTGCNAVLRSLRLAPGDEILLLSLAYPAIKNAARHVAAISGATLVTVDVPLPLRDEHDLLAHVAARLSPRTRLAIFDHIASHSALILPVAALTKLAQDAGARVLIDGAHVPGMLPLDVSAVGADWYVGNLHKWFFAPRACGFLWAREAARRELHPPVISVGYGHGFHAEFGWTGTRDMSNCLAAPAGLDFHASLGGTALMARNIAVARDGARLLASAWKTELGGALDMFGAMATIRLPIDGAASGERAAAIYRRLSGEHRIEVGVHEYQGAIWLRIAAQAYNEMADIERLAAAIRPPLSW